MVALAEALYTLTTTAKKRVFDLWDVPKSPDYSQLTDAGGMRCVTG